MKNQETNLKKLRKEYGYTQGALAEKIGCTEKTLRSWESGENLPGTYHLLKLADLFHVSTDYILDRSEFRSPENDFIGEYTGLSDQAVRVLHFLSDKNQDSYKENLEVLNYILEKQFQTEVPETKLSMIRFFSPEKAESYLPENTDNLFYFMRKCLALQLPEDSDERRVLKFEDGEKEEVQELRMQHYLNRITGTLTKLREEKSFQEWKEGNL